MILRRKIRKWLYGHCPGFAGSFPYYGTKVYFQKNSLIFNLACEQGVYEHENIKLLLAIVKPDTVYFDIGANIGLMSIPILRSYPTCTVISMEPSPNSLPFLIRTAEASEFRSRWHIVGKAAGNSIGSMQFFTASADLGAYDGFQDTKRAGSTNEITIQVTTIDAEWESMQYPRVSMIKIDVEGAELEVLHGAYKCIQKELPYILIEWSAVNFDAYNCKTEDMLNFAASMEYRVFSVPNLIPVNNATELKVQMLKTESFLLAPN